MKNKILFILFFSLTLTLSAEQIGISKDMVSANIDFEGKRYVISRGDENNTYITNAYSLTSRPSPPFFIQPFQVTQKVETFGELEVIEFLEKQKGIFIDARLSNWYKKSYITGAINIPFKIFLSDTPQRDDVLESFGGKKLANGSWDFRSAKTILLYCNGAWCGQSPTAIRALSKIGFPEEKMKYYRGGMQSWQLLGLSIIEPDKGDK